MTLRSKIYLRLDTKQTFDWLKTDGYKVDLKFLICQSFRKTYNQNRQVRFCINQNPFLVDDYMRQQSLSNFFLLEVEQTNNELCLYFRQNGYTEQLKLQALVNTKNMFTKLIKKLILRLDFIMIALRSNQKSILLVSNINSCIKSDDADSNKQRKRYNHSHYEKTTTNCTRYEM